MPNNIFETLISSFLKDKVGIVEHFLTDILSSQLKDNLLTLLLNKELKAASVGNLGKRIEDKSIRNDLIYWLDRKHNDVHENSFFDVVDELVAYLNRTCYTGITDFEFHYAFYEKGSFYKRHLDQFRSNAARVYSLIFYLNEDWQKADGGELCLHQNQTIQLVNPTKGKCVFFKSNELEHEVLLSHQPRMSIAGWLKV